MDKSNSHNINPEEKNNLTTELSGIDAAITEKGEDKEKTILLIKGLLQKGMTDKELLEMGLTAEDIAEAKKTPEDKQIEIAQQELNKKNQKEREQAIEDTLARLRTLAGEGIILRQKLMDLKEHHIRLVKAEEYIATLTPPITPPEDVVNIAEEKEEEEIPTSDSSIEQKEYLKSSRELIKEYDTIVEEIRHLGMFNVLGLRRREKKKKELKKEIEIAKERERKVKKEIEIDRKKKPFFYFIASKASADIQRTLTNYDVEEIDLRWLHPDNVYGYSESGYLVRVAENEGFFDFNILGFTKVIKNVEEIKGAGGLDGESPNAIYKIVGPDGTIIKDNIQGYVEATRIYEEATEVYKKKVEEEFKNLNQ